MRILYRMMIRAMTIDERVHVWGIDGPKILDVRLRLKGERLRCALSLISALSLLKFDCDGVRH